MATKSDQFPFRQADERSMALRTRKDYVIPASGMGSLLEELVQEPAPEKFKFSQEELKRLRTEVVVATRDNAFEMGIMSMGQLTESLPRHILVRFQAFVDTPHPQVAE